MPLKDSLWWIEQRYAILKVMITYVTFEYILQLIHCSYCCYNFVFVMQSGMAHTLLAVLCRNFFT